MWWSWGRRSSVRRGASRCRGRLPWAERPARRWYLPPGPPLLNLGQVHSRLRATNYPPPLCMHARMYCTHCTASSHPALVQTPPRGSRLESNRVAWACERKGVQRPWGAWASATTGLAARQTLNGWVPAFRLAQRPRPVCTVYLLAYCGHCTCLHVHMRMHPLHHGPWPHRDCSSAGRWGSDCNNKSSSNHDHSNTINHDTR